VLGGLVDLRDGAILAALGLPDDATRWLDVEVARAAADAVRAEPRHLGLIVPSMAFLDHPERPNVVLFGDRLPGGLPACIAGWSEVARIAVGG